MRQIQGKINMKEADVVSACRASALSTYAKMLQLTGIRKTSC